MKRLELLEPPGMGDRLGVKVQDEEVVLTPSRRQLRRREAGWEEVQGVRPHRGYEGLRS